ncbi:YdcF family protein [Longispora urticae]
MISGQDYRDGQTLYEYHQLGHELRRCSVGIVLGGHDLGVPRHAAELFHQGYFARMVVTGGPNRTRPEEFPDGEAARFRDIAMQFGVPEQAILLEPRAANTGQNISLSRQVLAGDSVPVDSVLIVSMPSMQRRAFATCRKVWPEVETVLCSSAALAWPDYIDSIGDEDLVLSNLVGDTQRVVEYPAHGYAIAQDISDDVLEAFRRLIDAGYTSRLM